MRIFNRYYTPYDLLLVFGDLVLVVAASSAVRILLARREDPVLGDFWLNPIGHGIVMAFIVVVAFYYSDLYSVDQSLSVRELLHRLVAGLGAACIVIGILSYPIPNFGKSIYLGEMIALALCLGVWRMGFMRMLRGAGVRAKVLIVGLRTIGKMVAEELYLKKKLGMDVVGFVGDHAGIVQLSYGNPKKVELPMYAPQSLRGLITHCQVNRIFAFKSFLCKSNFLSFARDYLFC